MKKFSIITIYIIVFIAQVINAQNKLDIRDFSIAPGETKYVDILIHRQQGTTGFQFQMRLPNGIALANTNVENCPRALLCQDPQNFVIIGKEDFYYTYVVCFSPFVQCFKEELVAQIAVTASSDFYGENEIEIHDIILSNINNKKLSVDTFPDFTVHVKSCPTEEKSKESMDSSNKDKYDILGRKISKPQPGQVYIIKDRKLIEQY